MPRVQEYLEVLDTPPTHFAVVEYLRDRYAEYGRLKLPGFNKTVTRVLALIKDEEEQEQETKKRTAGPSAPSEKKPKKSKKFDAATELPELRFADIGGLDDVIRQLTEVVQPALLHPELFEHLGVKPPTGVLLHGPAGTGKSLLARTLASEMRAASDGGLTYLQLAGPEVVSGMSGESEAKLRSLFADAAAAAPCIVFIDEVDAITGKREAAGKDMERRIVAQLLACLDQISGAAVVVVAATNRPDALDPALRRAGRFDREIGVGIPDDAGRAHILRVLCAQMKLSGALDLPDLAKRTPGYVGADLAALTKEAAASAVHRAYAGLDGLDPGQQAAFSAEQMAGLFVEAGDFEQAMAVVQPSAKREGFATIPDVSWADVGALDDVRRQLHLSVVLPIRSPRLFARLGLVNATGICMFGPPGCGKTLTAKAIANESRASFIAVKGPELLNKFVGESERAVRQVFQRAQASAPAIIFFDELDALCPKRGAGKSDSVTERVVNQLLAEMDGLDARKQVFVIAATNRPDIIDPAMLRPGRLDKLVYIPLPGVKGREAILRTAARTVPLAPEVSLQRVSEDARCAGFSGADCCALVKEAASVALQAALDEGRVRLDDEAPLPDTEVLQVRAQDFEQALAAIHPSVSEQQRQRYDRMHQTLCCSRANLRQDD